MRMTQVAPDFRMEAMGTYAHHNGRLYLIRTCEELVAGRWEGFVSMQAVKRESR